MYRGKKQSSTKPRHKVGQFYELQVLRKKNHFSFKNCLFDPFFVVTERYMSKLEALDAKKANF